MPLSCRDAEAEAVRDPAARVLEGVPSSPLAVGGWVPLPVPLCVSLPLPLPEDEGELTALLLVLNV